MSNLFNLVRVSTPTTGTGTVTLGAAISGFQTFAAAGVTNGMIVSYAISDGANSEMGTGVYNSTGPTLTRSVTSSTNSNAAISLSGSAQVFIDARAQDILNPANNLSDVGNVSTARSNLGLGAAATHADTDFVRTDAAQSLTAPQQAQGRANIGVGPFGQCVLFKSGSNIVLSPKNGNLLTINGVGYVVPDAGVSLAPTGLTAATTYYIYAYMSAGVMTLEASTTGHSTSTTAGNKGVEIKTGDDTRSLVGMAYVLSGPAFIDAAAYRLVRSWFNRKAIAIQGPTIGANVTIGSSPAEVSPNVRVALLAWSDETIATNLNFSYFASNAGVTNLAASYDGSPDTYVGVNNVTTGNVTPFAAAYAKDGLSEGYHLLSMMVGSSGSSTMAYAGSFLTGVIR